MASSAQINSSYTWPLSRTSPNASEEHFPGSGVLYVVQCVVGLMRVGYDVYEFTGRGFFDGTNLAMASRRLPHFYPPCRACFPCSSRKPSASAELASQHFLAQHFNDWFAKCRGK